ncbi:MAG: hypothetical protein QOE45_3496 [Frankiaceae bacterium]|nr:hypothetical protein [Frankiaceae bacterium]
MEHFAGLDVSIKETSSAPNRRHITVRRRDDAGDALRSRPYPAVSHDEMVLAQGLGDADRQAPRAEKGDCGPGPSAGRDHAWNDVPRGTMDGVRSYVRLDLPFV